MDALTQKVREGGRIINVRVVSALGRSLPAGDGRRVRIVDNVIQTDAALHPGSSGAALADGTARVVGVSTAVIGPGVGQGLGLAVPINDVTRDVVSQLLRTGRVRRAYLGLGGGSRPLPPRTAERLGQPRAIEVTSVMTSGPAVAAGLRPGDLLVAFDGHPLAAIGDLQRLLSAERVGRPDGRHGRGRRPAPRAHADVYAAGRLTHNGRPDKLVAAADDELRAAADGRPRGRARRNGGRHRQVLFRDLARTRTLLAGPAGRSNQPALP